MPDNPRISAFVSFIKLIPFSTALFPRGFIGLSAAYEHTFYPIKLLIDQPPVW